MPIKFTERYYNTKEAAKILHVTPDTVKRYCNADPPKIAAEKIGRDWMIPKSSLYKYIREESDFGRPRNRHRKTG